MGSLGRIENDEWSSAEEIERSRVKAEEDMKKSHDTLNEFGSSVEETLASHASFTLSLLERLCNAIKNSSSNIMRDEIATSLITAREFHAARLLWRDRTVKLSSEVIGLSAKLNIVENEKRKIERRYDKAVVQIKELLSAKSPVPGHGAVLSELSVNPVLIGFCQLQQEAASRLNLPMRRSSGDRSIFSSVN